MVHADGGNAELVAAAIGVSITSGTAGANINLVLQGPIDVAGLGLSPGPVFVGPAGALVSTPPATGVLRQIGHASTSAEMIVDPHPIIARA